MLPSRSYAPNTGVVLSPETGAGLPGRSNDIARSGAMWLGGVVVWGAISYWILRQRNSDDTKGGLPAGVMQEMGQSVGMAVRRHRASGVSGNRRRRLDMPAYRAGRRSAWLPM